MRGTIGVQPVTRISSLDKPICPSRTHLNDGIRGQHPMRLGVAQLVGTAGRKRPDRGIPNGQPAKIIIANHPLGWDRESFKLRHVATIGTALDIGAVVFTNSPAFFCLIRARVRESVEHIETYRQNATTVVSRIEHHANPWPDRGGGVEAHRLTKQKSVTTKTTAQMSYAPWYRNPRYSTKDGWPALKSLPVEI